MAYKKNKIDLSDTAQFSKPFVDYITGDEKLKKFYTYLPEISSFKQAIADRSKLNINRQLLADVITDQYNSRIKVPLADFQETNSRIELLRDKDTYTVCTGHQLCLFTGPLYFIYKIISTINLAEALKKAYPENNFVPVYWMASEDHDFEEIRAVHLFNQTLSWDADSSNGAVGRLNTASISKMLEELSGILGDSQNAKELILLYENAYLKHNNLADATRYLVHELFGKYGLLVIDADDKRLKSEFMTIMKDDISNQTNFKIVNQTISELEKIGIQPQVNPREINVFRLKEERIRIKEATEEMLALSPEEYSPNVVLRPMYQQMILPNIAYVGGPGEIAYWLEFKAMFQHHSVMFPVLIPRNFALLTDEKLSQQLQKLNFSNTDIFKEHDRLIREFINIHASNELSLKDQEEIIRSAYSEISGRAAAIDATLKGSVEAEMQKALNGLKTIENKLLRSEKQKQETSINQIKKIKEKYFPGGNLQERHDNISSYYIKYGNQLIADLKNAFQPFEFEMLILELN
jgi:bacillithiol biosynthesis cysteine-adding enzyme BshC